MIMEQYNGFVDLQVTQVAASTGGRGVLLASGLHNGETFIQRGKALELPDQDRRILFEVFNAGQPDIQGWPLSEGKLLYIYGVDCDGIGDWTICKDRECLLRGSLNFKEFAEALKDRA